MRAGQAAMLRIPRLLNLVRLVLRQFRRELEDDTGIRAVAEEPAGELLQGQSQPDGILARVQTGHAATLARQNHLRNMQHLILRQEQAPVHPVAAVNNLDQRRVQNVQLVNLPGLVPQNLHERVPVNEQRDENLVPERRPRHVRVRLVDPPVTRPERNPLAVLTEELVQRQRRDRVGDEPDARVEG